MEKRTKVLVGFSGGVDSTAAVILLKRAGYDVVGLSFNVLNDSFPQATFETAEKLGIKLITKCVSKDFSEKVIKPFKECYEQGLTPNPCIFCNPNVKFKTLIDTADEEGCEYIATGHYAGVKQISGNFYIEKAINEKKDQSYMLYRLPQSVLKRLILPLRGVIDKADVRALLQSEGMPNAQEKDSQDICFIPDGNYFEYLLSAGAKNSLGSFLDTNGNVISEHKGILNYTIGQRKGLGLALGKPAYVVDIKGNDVIIGSEEDLYQDTVFVSGLFWTNNAPANGEKCYCKLRYSAREALCSVQHINDQLICLKFEQAQRGPTPGQSAVLYYNKLVIGGGYIVK